LTEQGLSQSSSIGVLPLHQSGNQGERRLFIATHSILVAPIRRILAARCRQWGIDCADLDREKVFE
jgi:hypothetical protein